MPMQFVHGLLSNEPLLIAGKSSTTTTTIMTEYMSIFVPANFLAFAAAGLLLYVVGGATYRLYLSPLAKFPGRKLAALTLWYEFYHDYFRRGQYTWEIADMHEKCGPIVRISPHELHINDPEFYDHLYGTTLKLDKNPWITKQFGNQLSTMGTASHDLHKLRRKAIAPFLSSTRIIQLEGLITSKIERLCDLFSHARDSKTALNIHSAYRATAVDIISDYCMAESWNFLDKPDFGRDWFRMIQNGSEAGFLLRQFPWFLPALKKLPYDWVIWLFPDAAATLGLHRKNEQQVKAILMAGPDAPYSKSRPPVFYDLLFNSSLPSHEKTIDRMAAEGTLLIIAGSESVGSALTSLHFRLLEQPDKYKVLQKELKKAIPDESRIPRWSELKELPYLTACIEENLRITNPGVVHRLARLAPREGIKFGDYSIPAGTPISMNSYNIHMNPTIFPSPKTFFPERWLVEPFSNPNNKNSNPLRRYLIPFTKGPRQCLGMDLAYAEMYLAAAIIHRRFPLTELFNTGREDVDVAHDFFNPYPNLTSEGVRVLVG